MPFDLTCPHCAKPMRVPDEMMGRRVACPHCTGQMDLPPAALPLPLPPAVPPPPPPPDPFGFVPKPGAPPEPLPTHDRRRPAELPRPWRGVYRGFRLLQLAGLLLGGGVAGFGLALVALIVLRVPGTDTQLVFLPFVLLAGTGAAAALIGYLLAGRVPGLDVGRLVLDWVLFWIGLPVFIFVLTLLWWRYLRDLSRLLQVPALRTRAVQFWWAFVLAVGLILAAFVVLFALGSKASRESRLAREQVELAPRVPGQDQRARDRVAEEAGRRADYAVRIVSHGIAGALFVAAGAVVALGYVAAHRAAARAVLLKAPEEPPDDPRPRRRRPDRDRYEDDDDRPRRRRRRDDD